MMLKAVLFQQELETKIISNGQRKRSEIKSIKTYIR